MILKVKGGTLEFKNKFFKYYISIFSSDSGLAESFFRKKNIMVKRKYHDNRFDNND